MEHTGGIRVRGAEPRDSAAIDRLIVCLDEFHARARPDLFRVPASRPRGEQFLQSALDDPEQGVFVAVMQGAVVGYAHILIKHTAPAENRFERRYSEIDTISVHPAAQRLGAGRALIQAALDWAASRNIHDHQIAVHEFNRSARALYEQLGFIPSVTVLRHQD